MIQTLTIRGDKKKSELKIYQASSDEKVTQTRFNISSRNFGKQFPRLWQPKIFSDFDIKPKITTLKIKKLDIYMCSNKNFQDFSEAVWVMK